MKVLFAIVSCLVLGTLAKSKGDGEEPKDLVAKVSQIPTTPTCSLRPMAVNEIAKLRLKYSDLQSHISREQTHAFSRKQYIKRMTAYLNSKIEELNTVKSELELEEKWLKVSDQRLKSYQQKEKLIKLEDVLKCLTKTRDVSEKNKASHDSAIEDLTKQKSEVEAALEKIKTDLKDAAGSTEAKKFL